ncbi:hypothetical protein CDL12_03755 [Handroanthus impetiginosus]|uniref:FAS1 domain-containing protein n=1 Tax=Handroanthus impetiginosus TaxID=429701 RepID=A0A2G9I159_9LAMI|nr:hypothetical protein CDL12_03755 [Handroanthus impetiginosus]
MILSLVSTALILTSAMATNQDLITAVDEMQKANYFTFVMLINMAPPNLIQGNITFLMPNDQTLSKTPFAEISAVNFLLFHSIPSPLLIDHLDHFPTGSMIPTSRPGFVLKVTNHGRDQFFLNNVRVVSPNICTKGYSIRCHGIDSVIHPLRILQPNIPPEASCPNSTNLAAPSPQVGGGGGGPILVTAPPLSGEDISPPKSSSPKICSSGLVNLIMVIMIYSLHM